eukprot:1132349-Rhodomonas_salina.1
MPWAICYATCLRTRCAVFGSDAGGAGARQVKLLLFSSVISLAVVAVELRIEVSPSLPLPPSLPPSLPPFLPRSLSRVRVAWPCVSVPRACPTEPTDDTELRHKLTATSVGVCRAAGRDEHLPAGTLPLRVLFDAMCAAEMPMMLPVQWLSHVRCCADAHAEGGRCGCA